MQFYFFLSSPLSFCLLLCTSIPALLAILLQVETQWKALSHPSASLMPKEGVAGTTEKAVVSGLVSS